jgi:hypothetical protein
VALNKAFQYSEEGKCSIRKCLRDRAELLRKEARLLVKAAKALEHPETTDAHYDMMRSALIKAYAREMGITKKD